MSPRHQARDQALAAVVADVVEGPTVDLVADLERPLPVDGGCVDQVFAVHVLEHVRDLIVSATDDSVVADLQPVEDGEPVADGHSLALHVG